VRANVIILGAGAIGLTLAYELVRRGRTVTVIERDRLLAGNETASPSRIAVRSASSWAAAGILPPANQAYSTDPIDRLRGLSHQLFPELADRLLAETGIDSELERCGGWYLADTIGETASMVGMVAYWRQMGIECHERGLEELVRSEPALGPWAGAARHARAWWVPDEYQIRTPMYLSALVEACHKQGVTFLDRSTAVDINETTDGVTVWIEGQARQTLSADQAVVCAGTWSGLIAERLRLSRSLVPVRGQMLVLKSETRILSSVINFGQRYLVPRRDGTLLVGSCEEEVGFQHGTTPGILSDLREFVRVVCPTLQRERQWGAWSGLRPMTFDGFPICGKLPGSKSMFVATGHFRSGIHLSPGTAVCLADMLSGQPPPIPMEAFGVGKQQMQHDPRGPTRQDE
jgi:glycine oxidase